MIERLQDIKVLIVDDEPEAISLIENLLSDFSFRTNITSFTDPHKAFDFLVQNEVDVLLLDIQMPGLNGIELLALIEKNNIHTHIIIVTAYQEHIVKAAHFGLIDYLLKPVDKNLLLDSLRKFALHDMHHSNSDLSTFLNNVNNKICIPTSFSDYYFQPDEISYIVADSNYSNIYTTDEIKYTSSYNIGRIFKLLPETVFFRISRSTIINFNHLRRIDRRKKVVVLGTNELELPYSNTYLKKTANPLISGSSEV